MPKHSPAPWKVFPTLFTKNEYTLWDKNENYFEDASEEVKKGNARLMEASLPLLVALKELLHNVEHGNGSEAWTKSIEKAKSAIAQAGF